jgi:hypothetical protein
MKNSLSLQNDLPPSIGQYLLKFTPKYPPECSVVPFSTGAFARFSSPFGCFFPQQFHRHLPGCWECTGPGPSSVSPVAQFAGDSMGLSHSFAISHLPPLRSGPEVGGFRRAIGGWAIPQCWPVGSANCGRSEGNWPCEGNCCSGSQFARIVVGLQCRHRRLCRAVPFVVQRCHE